MKREHLKPRVYHSIAEMQRAFGLPQPLHPLISLLDFNKVQITAEMLADTFAMDFYNITYNESAGCRMRYGQTTYDFQEGGMFFSSPGQPLTGIQVAESTLGFTLLVHPDFLRNYPLDAKMKHYGFFSYSVTESLHLSDKEKLIIEGIASNIGDELETAIDDLSQDVLISQLELMLNYSQRFYKRQFITRNSINNALLEKLNQLLNNYFDDETALLKGLPSVQYLSDELHVSPRYLGDMLRALTGQNTQQHIHNKLIEKAKEVLTFSDLTVGEIAYQLGFEHPQSFSKLFKSKTNFSPLEFRASFN
ncbi:helix-turn-helix transcriptional regulator [Dyadobacter chenwenxiniae]|uniref:Helix-turn-helix transcriptional regulator n=1 Tax=Dyadobacter chenwenxiniae TaxID=2906456 RepID=A0A9X1PPY6_9BACT|nr:helix-turn-helix transcriptional regulator [Dyadobacter chenwenxiniae]MCF0064786.1 helix-turn-helix transcriptional regulator [Dyadobacter chenwenxiniae]UON84158.1 helix-turn-helix transcriptional regulator [Dyadobacter chenwenxiniae]